MCPFWTRPLILSFCWEIRTLSSSLGRGIQGSPFAFDRISGMLEAIQTWSTTRNGLRVLTCITLIPLWVWAPLASSLSVLAALHGQRIWENPESTHHRSCQLSGAQFQKQHNALWNNTWPIIASTLRSRFVKLLFDLVIRKFEKVELIKILA